MPKQLTEDVLTGNILHEWVIQEYEKHERGTLWYVLFISVGLLFVIFGFLSNNFLFSLIIILSAIIFYLQSHLQSPQVLFQITELGIVLGDRFYSYHELDNFYIIYQPPEIKNLFIQTKSTMRPTLSIPLLDVNPVEIRQSLLKFVTEDLEQEEEPQIETVTRRWKLN